MWLSTSCELSFDIQVPTPFILMLRLRRAGYQWVAAEDYEVTPKVPVIEFTDQFGNFCQRLVAPPGQFRVLTSAEVMTQAHADTAAGAAFTEIQKLPESVLPFLLPSRYCESDRYYAMASDITANAEPGYDQVAAIEQWVRDHIQYLPGSSPEPVSASEVHQRQSGVCRDLSHLGIALCRSLCIPARLTVGYLLGLQPMDMHAWFEAFVGGRWYTFDATQSFQKGAYVTVGYGRDAADVALYNQFGPAVFPLEQDIQVELLRS